MTFIGRKDINGQEVEIHADSHGMWRLRLDGQEIGNGETLDAATAKARNAINKRKVKVNVPFVTRGGQRGVATGFHGGTNKLLVRVDGEAMQYDRHVKVLRADTSDDMLKEMLDKRSQARKLVAEADAIEKEHAFNLLHAVTTAVDAGIARQEATP